MGRKWFVLAALAVLGYFVAATLRKQEPRAAGSDWPANFAHRGDSTRAPENTLEAFRRAVEAGAGGLELDVHLTRDGHVVVIHDATLDRTTSGSGAVDGRTLEELKGLDSGHCFSPDGGTTYPYRGLGLGVPTLAEVLEEFPDVSINIDIKDLRAGCEAAVVEVLRKARAEGRALIVSTYHPAVRRVRKVSGGSVATGASRREVAIFYLLSALRLEGMLRPDYDALQVPVSYGGLALVTRRFVEAAHARGVRVDAWTINDPAEMRRLLDLGVDVVMTDRPDTLAGVLAERERLTPR
ncbi:MAG: glycerophosphodiester phosphodiesterase [Actinomycetota bacterium]|nr:glycerophosphodiester phosphodiesterase [Actinomycetota bacterium]